MLAQHRWDVQLPTRMQTPVSRAVSVRPGLSVCCEIDPRHQVLRCSVFLLGSLFWWVLNYAGIIIKFPSSVLFSFSCLAFLSDNPVLGHRRQVQRRMKPHKASVVGSVMECLPSIQKPKVLFPAPQKSRPCLSAPGLLNQCASQ